MNYDAVVVGAGPAGSMAALHLARAGARVLLLEKERLGRDKPCGGGLTARAYVDLEVPIDDLVDTRADGVELQLGTRIMARLRAPAASIWMVRRPAFDRRLAEGAAQAGADLHEQEPATAAEATGEHVAVETPYGRYTAPALLLACGAETRLRTALGFPSPRFAAPAVELEGPAYAAGLDASTAALDYSIPGGYAWAFPKGECWNVGVASTDPREGPRLRQHLARFTVRCGLRFADSKIGTGELDLDPTRASGRRIPLWDGHCSLAHGRVALLGDTAGLADPFFGEGIASALASGRLAARATLDLLAGRAQDLTGYAVAVRTMLGPHLRRLSRLARIVYPWPGLYIRALAAFPLCRRYAAHVLSEPWERP